jgi:hypothetical protein
VRLKRRELEPAKAADRQAQTGIVPIRPRFSASRVSARCKGQGIEQGVAMFANGDAPTEKGKVKPEYVRMYYEHQYDRMAKLEDQAMTITNVVVTLTVVVLTFGLGSTISPAATVALSLVMVLANGFAIFYTVRTGSWIQTHRLRAKRTLKEFAPALYNLDNTTFAPHLVFRQISGRFCSCVESPSGRKLGVWRLQPLSKSRFNA